MSFLSLFGALFGCNGQKDNSQKAQIDALFARELRNQEAAKDGNKNPLIEVIDDAQQVAQLRKDLQANIEQQRAEAAANKSLAERYKSGDRKVVPEILQVLKSGSAEQKSELLSGLGRSYDDPEEYTIAEPALVEQVFRHIDDPAHEKEAVQLAGINQLAGYDKKLEARLLSGRSTDAGRILFWLGKKAESEQALDYVAGLIRDNKVAGKNLDDMISGLEGFGRNGNAAVKKRVGDMALAIYERKLLAAERFEDLKNSAYTSDAAESLLTCLFEWGDSRVVPIAKDVLSRRIRVTGPVKALVRLEGERHLDKVYQFLKSGDDFFTGFDLVESIDRKYVDDRMLKEVLVQFARRKEITDYEVERVVRSYTGMHAEAYLENSAAYVADRRVADRIQKAYHKSRIPLDEVLADLVRAGLIRQAPAPAVVQKVKGEAANDPLAFIYGILEAQKVYLAFDAETGFVPADYDKLLYEFAAHSEGVLEDMVAGMDAKEDAKGERFDYTVKVVYKDKAYIARPEDMGDWYDIMTVNALLDKLLGHSGSDKRFVSIDTGDQTVQYIFGDPATIRDVLKKYAP